MYKFRILLDEMNSFFIAGDFFFRNNKKDSTLSILNKDFTEVYKTKEAGIFGFIVFENTLIYSSKESKSTIRIELDSFTKIYEFDDLLVNLLPDYKLSGNKYFGYSKNNGFVIFDLAKGIPLKKIDSSLIYPKYLYHRDEIIAYDKKRIRKINRQFDIAWTINLNDEILGESIDSLYNLDEASVGVLKHYIFKLDNKSGNLLWKTQLDYKPYEMAIEGDMGYLLKGNHYTVINLSNGHIEFERELEPIHFHGHDLRFDGYGRLYHKGLIWCCIRTHGYHFVAALYPENGEVVWLENVNTPHSLKSPKFHADKMYVLDSVGTLHVYEKD